MSQRSRPTWVKGLRSPVQQANVNATQVNNVVQGCYHHSPYSSNQSHHGVDQKEEVRQEEQTLSANPKKTSKLMVAMRRSLCLKKTKITTQYCTTLCCILYCTI